MSWSCRPDVATARRAGWRRPQETATVRRRAGPLLPALGRLQKTRGSRLGSCSRFGASAAVASSSLASHKTHETGSIWLQRSASDLCAAVRHRSDCETTSSAAAETKSCCIQFCMALRRSIKMRQTVLALAICGASALQPARNARRQSLAVRQAPRGVRQRAVPFKKLRSSAPSRLVYNGASQRHHSM